MKKLFAFLLALMSFNTISAQEELKDLVILKTGAEVRGTIIEHVEGESITIKTDEGRKLLYDIDEIERFIKITVKHSATPHLPTHAEEMRKYPWRPRGYRGFFDIGMAKAFNYSDMTYQFTTSQGFQADPFFYMGIGVSANYDKTRDWLFLPIFANMRFHILDKRLTPFIDVKAGYSPTNVKGAYVNVSLGCHYSISRNLGLNISIGYDMQKYDERKELEKPSDYMHGINTKIGIEF